VQNEKVKMLNKKQVNKLKKRLREIRRLRRDARALKPKIKDGIDALEIEIDKVYGDLRARLKVKYNVAAYRFSQHLSLIARLENHIAELEKKIEENNPVEKIQ